MFSRMTVQPLPALSTPPPRAREMSEDRYKTPATNAQGGSQNAPPPSIWTSAGQEHAQYKLALREAIGGALDAAAIPTEEQLLLAVHKLVLRCLEERWAIEASDRGGWAWGELPQPHFECRLAEECQPMNGGGMSWAMWTVQPERGQQLVARLRHDLIRSSYYPLFITGMQQYGLQMAKQLYASTRGGAPVLGFLPVVHIGGTWKVPRRGELCDAVKSGKFHAVAVQDVMINVQAGMKQLVENGVWRWPALMLCAYGMADATRKLVLERIVHPDIKPDNFLLAGLPGLLADKAHVADFRLERVTATVCDFDDAEPADGAGCDDRRGAEGFCVPETHAGGEYRRSKGCTAEQMMACHVARSSWFLAHLLPEVPKLLQLPLWQIGCREDRVFVLDGVFGLSLPAELRMVLAGGSHPVPVRRMSAAEMAEQLKAQEGQARNRYLHCDKVLFRAMLSPFGKKGKDTTCLLTLAEACEALCGALQQADAPSAEAAARTVDQALDSLNSALMQLGKCSWRGSPVDGFLMRLLRVALAAHWAKPTGGPYARLSQKAGTHPPNGLTSRGLLHVLVATGNVAAVRTVLDFGSACGLGDVIDAALACTDKNGDTPAHLGLRCFQPAAVMELLEYVRERAEMTGRAPPEWLYGQDKDAGYSLLHLVSRMPLGGPADDVQALYDARAGRAFHNVCSSPPELDASEWPFVEEHLLKQLAGLEAAVLRLLRCCDPTRSGGASQAADCLMKALTPAQDQPAQDQQGAAAAVQRGRGAGVRMRDVATCLLRIKNVDKELLCSMRSSGGQHTPLHFQAALGCHQGVELLEECKQADSKWLTQPNAEGRTPRAEARWCNPWTTTEPGGRLLRAAVAVRHDVPSGQQLWEEAAGLRRWLGKQNGAPDQEMGQLVAALLGQGPHSG